MQGIEQDMRNKRSKCKTSWKFCVGMYSGNFQIIISAKNNP